MSKPSKFASLSKTEKSIKDNQGSDEKTTAPVLSNKSSEKGQAVPRVESDNK